MTRHKPSTNWPAILGYGALAALVLACLQVLRHSYVAFDLSVEIYSGLAGILFLTLGIGLGRKFWQAKHPTPTPRISEPLSGRETQVLSAASSGLSNQEIAETLFISLSTVKTHLSSTYSKLNVKRRTQAIDHARQLKIIE